MRPSFHPRLVNGPFEDPALFIPFFFEKRALLFDMGDLHHLPRKEMLKLTHGFATHTHMDHFAGFDTLLRTFLGRQKAFHVFGPPNFLKNIEGKLAAYTWNLVENYSHGFLLKATEVHPTYTITQVYQCKDGFRARRAPEQAPFDGTLLAEPAFSVHAIHLDHKIPCLGFTLKERFHVNIMKDSLKRLKIPVGPWLRRFKEALYKEQDLEEDFQVVWKEDRKERKLTFRLGDLIDQIARISPGQKITYIVDVVFSPENIEKIIDFARHADHLYIEAAFLDAEMEIARNKYHLTAKQAGILAKKAGVKQFTLFHFSPRYAHSVQLLQEEADRAFAET
ncbi:MAG: ribonuclease Z [Deltaproteobacteria bacterium]|nr:ribonuclease Z [Deltaproteobacteria bacterium]MBW2018393.1 ribonuclease Z [Deltaproteobacteria bacterium]MBW2073679.1 ribonuclease Z [Deltaproteobacteria bacterium]RLB82804.1 MAG: ribonuclease Z [Deltaproteobacteria bacterium]